MTDINEFSPCQCCESLTILDPGGYEICPVCGWEDDPVQNEDPDYAGGANGISLSSARAEWKLKQQQGKA